MNNWLQASVADLQLNQANNLLLIDALVSENSAEWCNAGKVLQKVDALRFFNLLKWYYTSLSWHC